MAVHESGHALVAALSAHADPVAKVTILPAGQALGVTEQLPVDERHLYPRELPARTRWRCASAGGRPSGWCSARRRRGASNDLARRDAARDADGAGVRHERPARAGGVRRRVARCTWAAAVRPRDYAEATQRVIDEEVGRLLKEADERATTLLGKNRDGLQRVVDLLLERETIDGRDVLAAVGAPDRVDPVVVVDRVGPPV